MSKQAKKIVQRLVEDVINNGWLEMLDKLYAAEAVAAARRWFEPFRQSFPDVTMELVTLVAEGDVVVTGSAARAPTSAPGEAILPPVDGSRESMRSTSSRFATVG